MAIRLVGGAVDLVWADSLVSRLAMMNDHGGPWCGGAVGWLVPPSRALPTFARYEMIALTGGFVLVPAGITPHVNRILSPGGRSVAPLTCAAFDLFEPFREVWQRQM